MNQTEEKMAPQEELNEQIAEETVINETIADENDTDKTEAELTPEEKMQKQLTAYEEKIAAQQDQILRQMAEFDNYRKRTMKEKAELIKNGGEKTITAILPIIDDLERALQNMKSENEEVKAMYDGVELIYNKFLKLLQQEGLEKIDTHEAEFNTDYHEAIALVPAASNELKGKILDCVQTGYQLNDKVIRHSKVVVGQ
ncbi:MAG: nucleotide exchange factor GrpE [Bacteroidaceae bacterium]|nr:nucleotide exchange factor GrpE [Bacteroidaceae bacterium]